MTYDDFLANPPDWFLDALSQVFRLAFILSVVQFVQEVYRPDDAFNRVYLNAFKLGFIKPKVPCLIS